MPKPCKSAPKFGRFPTTSVNELNPLVTSPCISGIDAPRKFPKSPPAGKTLVNADHPQVIEVWNLVFMQYNRKSDGDLEKLPKTHIDTGMGFERLCMVIQGKQSNYDTDIFQPLIQKIASLSNKTYGKDENDDIAMRVIADHLRAVSFSIADGQLPSNTGAGYVIRRILRRAVRYAFTFLDAKEPFMYQLVKVLVQNMGGQFDELNSQFELIQKVIKEEENILFECQILLKKTFI